MHATEDKDTYRESDLVTFDINGNGSAEFEITDESTDTKSHGIDASLGLGGTMEVKMGLKLFGIGASSKMSITAHATGGYSHAWATANSDSFGYAGEIANIPPSGQTGEVVIKAIPYIGYLTTTAIAPPRTVTGLKVQAVTKDSAVLTWKGPKERLDSNGDPVIADHYKVYVSTSQNGEYEVLKKDGQDVVIKGDETTYMVTGLEPNTTYYFKHLFIIKGIRWMRIQRYSTAVIKPLY